VEKISKARCPWENIAYPVLNQQGLEILFYEYSRWNFILSGPGTIVAELFFNSIIERR
jgi:hypothetical protein